jgi:Tol biopolymer transport system component
MRLLFVAVLAFALAAAAAAADRASVGIAFVNDAGLYAVGADGSGFSLLRGYGCPPGTLPPCPVAKATSWSPDGSRLAFTIANQLYVYDSRDGSHRALTTGVDVDSATPPAWSPNGQELAFASVNITDDAVAEARPSGSFSGTTSSSLSDLYAVHLESGEVRKLTAGVQTTDPAWAPGPQIVYSRLLQGRWELFTVEPGGEHRRLTDGGAPVNRRASWSPDGTEIAFLRDAGGLQARLNAIRPDGTGLRQLSNLPIDLVLGDPPAWSPDGSLIAVSTSLNGRLDVVTGNRPGRDLYVVSADGSGERRLTQSAERGVADRGPTWSPDGNRLAFETYDRDKASESALYTANADGRCEMRVAAIGGWRPVWQPLKGAVVSQQQCSDLAVVATELTKQRALGRFRVRLLNDGTTPLSEIRLRGQSSAATIVSTAGRNAVCSLTPGGVHCRVASIAPGASVDLELLIEARVLTRIGRYNLGPDVRFVAAAGNRETSLVNNRLVSKVTVSSCTTRTRGGGSIRGAESDNKICGRRGNDRISGLAGDDHIEGGAGNDILNGGPGNDVIVAGSGRDAVSCGAGRDRATVDGADRVARDCERVTRVRSS